MRFSASAISGGDTSGLSMLTAPELENLGLALHRFAEENNKKSLKKLLKIGIEVDRPNSVSQTPLYAACFAGSEATAEYLLKHGANPNARCADGSTPVHAAALSGNSKLLSKLIEAGGDLRYHDIRGRGVKDWAARQTDSKRKNKMLEFLKETKHVATSKSGRDLLQDRQTNHYIRTLRRDGISLAGILQPSNRLKTLSLSSVQSLGYGKVYFSGDNQMGAIATIPLVQEGQLKHDEFGYTYNNGPFMVMESMMWRKIMVTVKRLHKERQDGGSVDLLIKESDQMTRLHHPNILLLMGICQTNALEDMVLLYERVGCGSLYSHLYQKVESIDTLTMCEILRQICNALIYIHHQNLLHCAVTSHAIQLISPGFAKLGNFEYMIQNIKHDGNGPYSNVNENKYLNAVFNWIAPEIIAGQPVTEKSDVYSLSAVMWEILHNQQPWSGLPASDISIELMDNSKGLEIDDDVPNPFDVLMKYGLCIDPKGRALTLDKLREVLSKEIVEYDSFSPRVANKMRKKQRAPPPPERKKSADNLNASQTQVKTVYGGAGDELDGSDKRLESAKEIDSEDTVEETIIQKIEVVKEKNEYMAKIGDVTPKAKTHDDGFDDNASEKTITPKSASKSASAYSCRSARRSLATETPRTATKSVGTETSRPTSKSVSVETPRTASRSVSVGTSASGAGSAAQLYKKPPSPSPIRSSSGSRFVSIHGTGPSHPVTSSPFDPSLSHVSKLIHDSDLPDELSRQAVSGSDNETPPPLPVSPSPALIEAIKSEEVQPVSAILANMEPRSNLSSSSNTPSNPFRKNFQNAPSDSEEKLFRGLNEQPQMSRFYSTTNAYLASLNRRPSEEVKSKSTVYGTLLREFGNTNSVPKPFIPYEERKDGGDHGKDGNQSSTDKAPSMTELKSAPGSSKHHFSGTGLSPPSSAAVVNRSTVSTMSSSFSNRSAYDPSSQSWSTSYKDSEHSYKPASHKDGDNVSPSKGISQSAHPIFGVPRPENVQLKAPSPSKSTKSGGKKGRQGVPKSSGGWRRISPRESEEPPAEMKSARKSIDKPDGIFKATVLSMVKPGEVKLKPIPVKTPPKVEESTSQSDMDTSIKSATRRALSPKEAKRKWKAAGKSIRDMISSFQNHANEHFKKQAILQLRSKRRPSGEFKTNIEEMKAVISHNNPQDPIEEKVETPITAAPREVSFQTFKTTRSVDRPEEKASVDEPDTREPPQRKTSEVNIKLQRVLELGPQHLHRDGQCVLIDCPAQQIPPHRTYSVHSTTDSEKIGAASPRNNKLKISAVVRNTLLSAHEDVMNLKTSANCPHKEESMAAVREQLRRKRPAQTPEPVKTNTSRSVNVATPDKATSQSPRTQATISLEIRPSRGNSLFHTPNKSIGASVSAPTAGNPPTTDKGSRSTPFTGSDRKQSSSSEGPTKDDIEVIYFDDELNSDTLKENHMRLQNTLPLDQPNDQIVFDDKPLFPDWQNTSTPCTSDVEHNDRRGSGEPYVTSPSQTSRKEDTDAGYHADQNTSMSSAATDYDTVDGDVNGVVQIEKHLSRSEEEGFTTTVTVKSDGYGSHTVSHKKTDLNTGDTKTTFKKKIKANQVITKVIVDDEDPVSV